MFETLITPIHLLVALAMLAGAGCNSRPAPMPAVPTPTPMPATASTTNPPTPGDTSVPAAQAALAASAGAPPAPTIRDDRAAPAHRTMTKAEESTAMPMAGQANNHSSTALDPPAKRASAP